MLKKRAAHSVIMSIAAAGLMLGLSGCGSVKTESGAKYPTGYDRDQPTDDIYAEPPSIFGKNGLKILGRDSDKGAAYSGETGIGVNSYLWRAALDTVSFMPLASADPFGGVILTDWYSAPGKPNERLKLNVFILDRQLRSDGVQVKVFRQVASNGGWHDAAVSPDTARQLEDTILTRARQIRVSQMGGDK